MIPLIVHFWKKLTEVFDPVPIEVREINGDKVRSGIVLSSVPGDYMWGDTFPIDYKIEWEDDEIETAPAHQFQWIDGFWTRRK